MVRGSLLYSPWGCWVRLASEKNGTGVGAVTPIHGFVGGTDPRFAQRACCKQVEWECIA